MSRPLDIVGQKWGRLTAVRWTGRNREGRLGQSGQIWLFSCECGGEVEVIPYAVKTGNTHSCGCLRKESTSRTFKKHGMSNSKENKTWRAMHSRCSTDPESADYEYYAARGISVCERWNDFNNFLADVGMCPDPTYSIDRIDNNGNYEPSNCRWASKEEQCRNTSRNRYLTLNGRTQLLVDWARELKTDQSVIRGRIDRHGWSVEEALTRPIVSRKKCG